MGHRQVVIVEPRRNHEEAKIEPTVFPRLVFFLFKKMEA